MKPSFKFLAVVAIVAATAPPIALAVTTQAGAASPRVCTSADLTLGLGPTKTAVAGERPMMLALRNHSSSACRVSGFPTVRLNDAAGHALAFRYTNDGSPYVTTAAARSVTIAASASAYVLVSKYRCTRGDSTKVRSVLVTLPGAAAASALALTSSQLGVLAYCVGTRNDPGQLVGVSPIAATPQATYAGARAANGTPAFCTSTGNWPTRAVTPAVVTVVRAYYAAKKLTPMSINKNREWVLNVVAQRVGTHWCLNADGGLSGYTGSVPKNATAAVMVLVTHKPYPVTGFGTHFVTVAKVLGTWRVVGEGTGP